MPGRRHTLHGRRVILGRVDTVTRALQRRLRRLRRRWGPRVDIVSETNPADPDVLPSFRFFAVLGTWMEQDVVAATVRNAFAQGAEAVYLVDNASTDATVEQATGAGATLAESVATDHYDERLRILLMNSAVARASLATGAEHVWWLWLDADEFPEGPRDMTVLDYLRTLDRRFRVVGSTVYNHFPTAKPEYLSGFHPLDFQPLCELFAPDRPRHCSQPHWKHPLQRFDRSGPFLASQIGFHSAAVLRNHPVVEPQGGIFTHHVQYRDESVTRARMEMLCGSSHRNSYNDSVGNRGIGRRFETLDAVYAQRWKDINHLVGAGTGVEPAPWALTAGGPRWYGPDELGQAKAQWQREHGAVAPAQAPIP
jgi:hypothetical protein